MEVDQIDPPQRPVHVEVCLHPSSSARPQAVKERVESILRDSAVEFFDGPAERSCPALADDAELRQHVSMMRVLGCAEAAADGTAIDGAAAAGVSFFRADVRVHVFELSDEGPSDEAVDGGGDDEEPVAACTQWVLPAREFDGLWASLVFEDGIKASLLEYANTAMLFSDAGVDADIVSWNRVVLLHGPPGTGKTSLCKALAHKLAVRLSSRFGTAALLEVNAHSLFSKWFSESGKLVMRLFQHIQELADDEDALVVVLIDEVESLSAARTAALSGSEPSDAIRVVNAVLTQLDALRRRKNVLVLTTSNITGAIDLAFVDRADVKQYVPLPGPRARFNILRSCVLELARAGVLTSAGGVPGGSVQGLRELEYSYAAGGEGGGEGEAGGAGAGTGASAGAGAVLQCVARRAEGLSGRALRKLPFQAHAFFVRKPRAPLDEFARALLAAVEKEHAARKDLVRGAGAKT
eukprot:g5262.t1